MSIHAHLVPHHVTQNKVNIWVAWWGRTTRPGIKLVLRSEDGQLLRSIALTGSWKGVGEAGPHVHQIRCKYKTKSITGLEANTHYVLEAVRTSTNGLLATAEFETLPTTVPTPTSSRDRAKRPFTILLGSCYSAPHDSGNDVSDAYDRLWKSVKHRPHLKLLVGDQVYVDQPAPMGSRKSSAVLRGWFIPKYRRTWSKLKSMLARGSNSMTSDDHEFWNDYPEKPHIFVWPHLHLSGQYRTDWKREARSHFLGIQMPVPIEKRDLDGLSIFVADTRRNRTKGGKRFMSTRHFEEMIAWIKGLHSPGVLVLGQPIFALEVSHDPILLLVSDHNLPHFANQYWQLLAALHEAPHDVLVLSGDVHYGRISSWHPSGATIWEVLSSAMTVLPSAKDTFEIPETHGRTIWWPPEYRKALSDPTVSVRREQIIYRKVVPQHDGGTENHFMTLAFTKHPSGWGVDVKVRAWLVNRSSSGGLPHRAWTFTIPLDVGRPPTDGTVQDRIITHVIPEMVNRPGWRKGNPDHVGAVANPSESWWSPDSVSEVVRNIRSGRVRYFVDGGWGELRPVQAVHSPRVVDNKGWYIRAKGDRRRGNNLDYLPTMR